MITYFNIKDSFILLASLIKMLKINKAHLILSFFSSIYRDIKTNVQLVRIKSLLYSHRTTFIEIKYRYIFFYRIFLKWKKN